MWETSVNALVRREAIKIGGTGNKRELGKESVYPVEWTEGSSVEEMSNDSIDRSSKRGINRGIFDLFFVKIRKDGVSSGFRAAVIAECGVVLRILCVEKELERREDVVKRRIIISRVGRRVIVIEWVESERKGRYARSRLTCRGNGTVSWSVEVERFIDVGVFGADASNTFEVRLVIVVEELRFDVALTVASLKTTEVGVRWVGCRVWGSQAELLEKFPFSGNKRAEFVIVVTNSGENHCEVGNKNL
jgi:hypothetical protein